MRMRKESRTTQIIHLLGNPALTHAQIAQSLGISTKTVQRVAKEASPDLQEADSKIAAYQRLLRKKLPIEDRVNLMQRIAKKADSNPFAAMRALERADDLDGVLTAKDRAKERQGQQVSDPRPMFYLPAGARININVESRPQPEPKAIDIGRPKVIDVTPGKDEPGNRDKGD